ncbi:MAG TPA: hydantoinase/oxoprolinase family protein [Steroidobacteraceae bacterium]|nr:hydantoinase/oxoprolinase family protein [Steroidobacteraceae bacterium]
MSEATATPVDSPELWIGLDTGGTYTDAVALDGGGRVIATAKALTTHWDLSVGLGEALHCVLSALPAGARQRISLVSVSTTLATNAVVENRFSPICAILIGFNDRMAEQTGIAKELGGVVVRVRGGHDPTGAQEQALEEAAVEAAVREFAPRVEAFAVAAQFSVRNPDHERRTRELIRVLCDKPVTCSHELSSQLNAPKRALTAALNARLVPQIRHLLDAVDRTLGCEGVSAPLMVVKGDGTLMRAAVALEYPVETVLSGPAASVVGAGFLTGLTNFEVADMGGTTTDVAIIVDGRPVVRPDGAVIGGWRTMVEAIDVRTCGLGGDSEVRFDREGRLRIGPRRVMPLSLLADRFPGALAELTWLAVAERLPPFAGQFAFRNPGREAGPDLDRLESRVWAALGTSPQRLDEVARTQQGLEALRRLMDRGLATLAGFTPSDALHVLGRQSGWSRDAARLGATILATEERNATARRGRDSPEELCGRVCERVIRQAARVVLESALAQDPGVEPQGDRWGPFGVLIERAVEGRPVSGLIDMQPRLVHPLVAIGAPAAAFYPEVARRLGAQLAVPEHAAVCNAVGAVVGVVAQTVEVLVNQPEYQRFRVHDPAGIRDFDQAEAAVAAAKEVSRELALAAARRAGALDPHVETTVIERRASGHSGDDYLAEATVRSRATGRPATGHAPPALHPPASAVAID